jgi:hypothetical protein
MIEECEMLPDSSEYFGDICLEIERDESCYSEEEIVEKIEDDYDSAVNPIFREKQLKRESAQALQDVEQEEMKKIIQVSVPEENEISSMFLMTSNN